MKTTLLGGMCLMAGISAQVNAEGPAQPADAFIARWSAPAMDRHVAMESVPPESNAQKTFRYMDMTQVKRKAAVRNAVIVYGSRPGSEATPGYRRNSAPGHVPAVLRPMS